MTMKTFLVAVSLGTGLIVSGMVTHADQTSKSLNADVQASDQSPVPLSKSDEPPQTSEGDSSGSNALKVDKSIDKESEINTDRAVTSNHTSSNQSAYSVQTPSSPPHSQNVPAISPATYYPIVKDPIYLLYDKALNQLFKEGQLNSLTIVLVIIIGYMIRNKQQPQMNETFQQTADHTASFLKKYIQHFLMILTIICLLVALFIAKQLLVLLI
ncbi:hypothetical protein SAMN05421743_12410 [Thalassobacillus cyri]|uniref:Uncharacterized protein n=1 Tax=Thalassobacillus cyri TaxID=571932 RepID=A0A1H4H8N3_9BACI|nr:hypothetical protein [Thalassobacillus cyri]SEB18001.1 hypothetical protein SAMN05421743_12410 [Thalassobacillus cyri]